MLKVNDRVFFAATARYHSVTMSCAYGIPVILAGDVVAIDEEEGEVFVQIPGGKLHCVPRGRVCSSEADAVELAAAPARFRLEREEREAKEGRSILPMRKAA
jgi:signal transduction protein with GAF and PtsI domain